MTTLTLDLLYEEFNREVQALRKTVEEIARERG